MGENWSKDAMNTDPESLIAIMHHLKILVGQIKPQGDMTFGEFCVMTLIEKETIGIKQRITPTMLNEKLGTKKPATSRMITVLEKKGYVVKISDQKDHRISYLELTQEGSKILSKERDAFHELLMRISKRIGQEEIVRIKTTLLHLSNILEEEIEVAPN